MRRGKTAQIAMSLLIIFSLIIGLPTLAVTLLHSVIGAWSILLAVGVSLAGMESLEWLGETR